MIELAYFGGFTHTEIADMLETPVGTVKGRMRLGMDKIRASLAEGVLDGATVTVDLTNGTYAPTLGAGDFALVRLDRSGARDLAFGTTGAVTTTTPAVATTIPGARDRVVGKALSLMHGQPAHSWTVESLAREFLARFPRARIEELADELGYDSLWTWDHVYPIVGSHEASPAEGRISGIVDIPNACATLAIPTEIFDFPVLPSANGPTASVPLTATR